MKPMILAITCFWELVVCTSLAFGSATETDFELSEAAGVRITANLAAHLETQNPTSLRKELKSVITSDFLDQSLAILAKQAQDQDSANSRLPKIIVKDRDHLPSGGRNATFTLYGRGTFFNNQTTKTKIKMRTRFYLQVFEDGKRVVRSPDMQDYAYLELKIKNPSAALAEVVHKHRFKIRDNDLMALYNTDPSQPTFLADLDAIKENVLNFADQRSEEGLITAMFAAIGEFAQLDRDFIRPLMAVSYERTAKKYKIEAPTNTIAALSDQKPIKISFQLTVDRNVGVYRPTLDLACSNFSFADYFANQAPLDLLQSYPKDAVAVEVKIPLDLVNKKEGVESDLFLYFDQLFIAPVFSEAVLYEGFELNKGKTHFFRQYIGEQG